MEGIHNFRDLGGYQTQNGELTREGVIFRSGDLQHATAADLERIEQLGIRTICDLRNPREHKTEPDRVPQNWGGQVIHVPIQAQIQDETGRLGRMLSFLFSRGRQTDFAEISVRAYQRFVTDFSSQFAQVLDLAADENNLPMLIHCTAGKDRTGFACSLIQLVLGVSREQTMQEYLCSNQLLGGFKQMMFKRVRVVRLFGVPKEIFLPLFEARQEYIEAAFNRIDAGYGSLENYVQTGLGFTSIENLKANLLETN